MVLSSPEAFRNALWMILSSFLVFLMQAGFLCVEAGLTRRKNSINVAIKNITDLGISVIIFWAFGYSFMFGSPIDGWPLSTAMFPDVGNMDIEATVFFLFHAMFCSTSVTILSGAVAERMTFRGYLFITGLVSGLLYPVFGRWAWNGLNQDALTGWLGQQGFVDFAGSTVVHSVGGWAALATVLIIGPRLGRFSRKRSPQMITSADAPLALLGALILWFGWFGFNGGSTLAFNAEVPSILVNTLFAGAAGLVSPLLWNLSRSKTITVDMVINGALAGLVAITANCHAVSSLHALLIGAMGGLSMMIMTALLKRYRLDDAVGAISVHLGGGIWGTLAVAFFADLTQLGTGLSRLEQLKIQLAGILACGLWTFTAALGVLLLVNKVVPLRVRRKDEYLGLNVTEHGARSDLHELYSIMKSHVKTGNLQRRVKADAFTEVGQISSWYNQVVQALERVIARLDAIVTTAVDGIMTVNPDTLIVKSTNPAVEKIFGHCWLQLVGQPLTHLINVNGADDVVDQGLSKDGRQQIALRQHLLQGCETGEVFEAIGVHRQGQRFSLEITATTSKIGAEEFLTLMVRDVSDRKKTEAALQKSELEARNNAKQLRATLEQLKQAQAKLLQSEKMSSLGQIVAGVAHEINNPVGFIHGNLKYSRDYVQCLLQALDHYQDYAKELPSEIQSEIDELDLDFLKQDFPQLLNSMQYGTERIQTIVQSLRNFSRFDEADCKVVDIHEGLESTLIMLAHQFEGGNGHPCIDVQKEYGQLPDVECYPGALNQVFLNILTNAVEALVTRDDSNIPNTIAISTGIVQMDGEEWVAIAIADNGDGIPKSLQTKIFDPFFTTKDVGTGTGMGLAISHQIIVEQHSGHLQCQSKSGEGTRFVITLPIEMSDGRPKTSVLIGKASGLKASVEKTPERLPQKNLP